MNAAISTAAAGMGDNKQGSSTNIWQRLKSKIETLGERSSSDTEAKEHKRGE